MLQHNRWNSLPDDIIAKIISHLNFSRGDEVTITTTNFNVKLLILVANNISEFWNILDILFTLFTTPSINTFSLFLDRALYIEPCVRPILDSWARRLRACNTRHMKINCLGNCAVGDRVCPPSIFQIHSLVTLQLSSLLFINDCDRFVSHPIILPNLEELSLGSVDYGLLGRILSSCPSLVYLCFSLNVKPKGEIRSVSISSKSLKRLRIILDMSSVLEDIIDVVIDAPILKNLILIADSSFVSMRTSDSIFNLKSLLLHRGFTTKLLNSPTKITFPNLTHLTLFEINSFDLLIATLKPQMLHCPNLNVLVLHFSTEYDIVWDTKDIFVLVERLKHLKLIMGTVRIDQQTLNLVTWLLRSAPVLKKLRISGYDTRPSDDSLGKFRKTLLQCAEDTSRCRIRFLGGYKLQ